MVARLFHVIPLLASLSFHEDLDIKVKQISAVKSPFSCIHLGKQRLRLWIGTLDLDDLESEIKLVPSHSPQSTHTYTRDLSWSDQRPCHTSGSTSWWTVPAILVSPETQILVMTDEEDGWEGQPKSAQCSKWRTTVCVADTHRIHVWDIYANIKGVYWW